jgi:hypothetical protein
MGERSVCSVCLEQFWEFVGTLDGVRGEVRGRDVQLG